ncbi:hypothetical protein BD413DRAFT_309400 [Trametes elegans]|nr:hypothetical protein BD413DRAFT_309400 [Trametes elegans]
MDADALYPGGHDPVRRGCSPDGVYEVSPLARIDHSVLYYFIDFGLACHLPPGSPSLVFGDVGRDSDVPELSSSIPYDAFKMDIFALGNLYAMEFTEKYNHLQFLEPLIGPMTREVPGSRPRAVEVLAQWQDIRNSLNQKTYRWRLTPKSAPVGRVIHETVAVTREGISNLKKYMT